jgi:hypothetical protein
MEQLARRFDRSAALIRVGWVVRDPPRPQQRRKAARRARRA